MSDKRLQDGWIERRDALRARACRNDVNAMLFLSIIMDAVELWDDLIDKDKAVSDETVNRVFINLMFWLPQNTFFTAHKTYLMPLVMTCINAWMDSNDLAQSKTERDLHTAWYLKQMGVELYGAVAFLIGGFDHMRSVSAEMRDVLAHEPFSDYLKESHHA